MKRRKRPIAWCVSEGLEMSKSLLIISRQSPWSGPSAREALDLALAGGAFDLPLGMLFLDDGVFQLASAQQPATLQQKDLGANLQALPLFGVESLYASARSLQERGLEQQALALATEVLDDAALIALIDRYDQVITL
jgi:tRNA 2-thiouridine synthesizing protein C